MDKSILNGLTDDQLREVKVWIDDLLRKRDEGRKAEALKQAAAILEAAGLNLKSLTAKKVKTGRSNKSMRAKKAK